MGRIRQVVQVFRAVPTIEGAGVRLKRAFGHREVPVFDPFLLLDDFHSSDSADYRKGFPWHPHRGIETITYVLHGKVDHGDSMGNSGTIGEGDVQWMTAGSGIIHQEMPDGDAGGLLQGFQLWANLPARDKMTNPRYRGVTQGEIPELKTRSGRRVKVIAGTLDGVTGPVTGIVTSPEYLDVTLEPRATFTHVIPSGRKALAYVIGGEAFFDPRRDSFAYPVAGAGYFDMDREPFIGAETVVLFGEGDEITIQSGEKGARFLCISGTPVNEPVAWYGPIVMNTEEELRTAFAELRDGSFIRKG